jgi:hypothetical protein
MGFAKNEIVINRRMQIKTALIGAYFLNLQLQF